MLSDSWELNAPANDEDGEPGGRKKRLLKKAPDAPKRFKTAYICFVMVMMDGVKEESPKNEKVDFPYFNIMISSVTTVKPSHYFYLYNECQSDA